MRYYLRKQRKTYIAQMEMMAALTPLRTRPRRFRGRRVLHFIDNTVTLSALVHGYAGKEDMATMVNAYHAMCASMAARVYFDYVPSKANLADLPSRGDYLIPTMLGATRGRMEVPTNRQLRRPLHAWMDDAEGA